MCARARVSVFNAASVRKCKELVISGVGQRHRSFDCRCVTTSGSKFSRPIANTYTGGHILPLTEVEEVLLSVGWLGTDMAGVGDGPPWNPVVPHGKEGDVYTNECSLFCCCFVRKKKKVELE